MEDTCAECQIVALDATNKKRFCENCTKKKRREWCKAYKQKNKDKVSAYNREYKLKHKKYTTEYNKTYNKANRKAIQKRQNKQHSERRKRDPVYKLSTTLRSRMNRVLKGEKRKKISRLLGCSHEQFVKWLEFQFTSEFNFENHGTVWHIDHVIPINKFNLLNDEDLKRCFHWSNMQPLECKKNSVKQDNTDLKEQHLHEIKMNAFVRMKKDYNLLQFDRTQYI